MELKKIAVIGSLDRSRADELELGSLDLAESAMQELGAELAAAGYHIVVYSAEERFIERDVVRGYIDSGLAKPGSIHVHAPYGWNERPRFVGEEQRNELFCFFADSNYEWEVSYYRSLRDVDGVLLVGGGNSAFITALFAVNYRIPIASVAAFGGSAGRVWQALVPGQDLISRDDKSRLGRAWDANSAPAIIQALTDQIRRREEEQEAERRRIARVAADMRWYAWLALVLFVVAFLAVPITWAFPNLPSWLPAWLLFLSPLVAGVSGATTRMIFDYRQGETVHSRHTILGTCALGLVAGGVAGVLFVAAQILAAPASGDPGAAGALQTIHLRNLIPFALVIGFTAGLTLDIVFRRLLERDVLQTQGLDAK